MYTLSTSSPSSSLDKNEEINPDSFPRKESVKSAKNMFIYLCQYRYSIEHCAALEKLHPYCTHGRSLEIARGKGVLKVKILEAKCEAKLEFPGGGMQDKKSSMGRLKKLGKFSRFWHTFLFQPQ